jgi:hypothetical protein
MPNGRLRIVPRKAVYSNAALSHREDDENGIIEIDLADVYRLVQWMNQFPK